MKQLKMQLFFVLFIVHQSLCQQSPQQYTPQPSQQYTQQSQQYNQQPSQYSAPSQPNKVQLEDIERDNLKTPQAQAVSPQAQPQQYLTYPQDQLIYTIQPQQAALFQTPQQPASLYSQPSSGLVSQQPQVYVQPYYTQPAQSYPYVDFGGFPLYPGVLPYVVPQTAQPGQVSPVVSDYYKTAQPSQAGVKTAQIQPSVKTPQTTQVPAISNYLLSNALPSAYYQPVSYTQPQNPQYYSYNSFYQLQNPSKSVFSSGIKSTTPSAPTKLKEEPFVPVNNGNYRYDFATAEQNNYNKVRVSG